MLTYVDRKEGQTNKRPWWALNLLNQIYNIIYYFHYSQNIVAEEREVQEMERLKREREREVKEKQREEARKRRDARRSERMNLNDFKVKGLKEWEIHYEFHIGKTFFCL